MRVVVDVPEAEAPVRRLAGRHLRPGLPRWRVAAGRIVSIVTLVSGIAYLNWRLSTLEGAGTFGVAFFCVEVLNFVSLALAAFLFWRPRWRTGPSVPPTGSLDVFIPVCGEPLEIVEATLRAALAIRYPHRTYVLNDGRIAGKDNWRAVEDLARRYGVPCFTRSRGPRGKAANLNHALRRTSGDFVAVIDADHRADPRFAQETMGYFVDDDVAFVSTPQHFDTDRTDILGNRELFFYYHVQPAKDTHDSSFSCGNGVVYRRKALDSISGFSEWNLVEDLHTSYELHAKGWRSVYHPRPVSIGVAPVTGAALAKQRYVWAADSLRIFLWQNPLLKRGLGAMQRLHYLLTTSFYFTTATQVVFLVTPALYLLTGTTAMNITSIESYLLHSVPFLGAIGLFLLIYGGVRGGPRALQQQLSLAPVYVLAFFRALTGVKFPSGVTQKGRPPRFSWLVVGPLLAALFGIAGLAHALLEARDGIFLAVFWTGLMAFMVSGLVTAVSSRPNIARLLRVAVRGIVVAAVVAAAVVVRPAAQPGLLPSLGGYSRAFAQEPEEGSVQKIGVPARGAYLGLFSVDPFNDVRSWAETVGAPPQIAHWYQQWLSGERRFRSDWLGTYSRHGIVPMITWEPWAKPDGVHDAEQPAVRLARIAAGHYDPYIRSWASAAAEYAQPIMIRFMHEMNGTWYPWSVYTNGNTPRTFVMAWRHVHDIFERAGADNVSWVWATNSFAGLSMPQDVDDFYPGRRYVDWVSMTGFNWGDSNDWNAWRSFDEVFGETYRALSQFKKPIMISEIGTVPSGGDPVLWVRDAMERLRTSYPRIKAVVWFDALYPDGIDFRLTDSTLGVIAEEVQGSAYWDVEPRIFTVPQARTSPRG